MITSLTRLTQDQLLTGTETERNERLVVVYHLALDLEEKYGQVLEENQRLRHDLDEETDNTGFWKNSANSLQLRIDELTKFMDWMTKLFSNKNMPTGVKLILWQYFMIITMLRATAIGKEHHISMQTVASQLGVNPATVRRATDKMSDHGLLDRRYEPYEENGEKRMRVHITLNDQVMHPERIDIGGNQGGDHKRKCPNQNCPSHQMPEEKRPKLQNYTVRYCECCDNAAWYGQVGLSNNASVLKPIGAIQRGANHIHRAIAPQVQEQVVQPQVVQRINNEVEEQVVQPAAQHLINNELDVAALDNELAKLADDREQVVTKHNILTVATTCSEHPPIEKHVTVCQMDVPLNKHGQPAAALEKVVSWRKCGSTNWYWSPTKDDRCCKQCHTPREYSYGSK